MGVVTGAVATIAVALASPGLYIDWGALPGIIVVVPLATIGLTLLVTAPLALGRRLTWGAALVAVLVAVVVGELIFLGSQGTAFARWSAARHWAASERQAAAARRASERETCRRLMAEPGAPPPPAPPAPPGGGAATVRPGPGSSGGGTLLAFDRERCRELIEREGP